MEKILVVEHCRNARERIIFLLEEEFSVPAIAVEMVDAARQILENNDICLIVTDVFLPGSEDGIKFIATVRGASDYDALPILAVSNFDGQAHISAVSAYDQTSTVFLQKPIDPEVFVETVRKLLRFRKFKKYEIS